jgi:hypothetical protein
MSGHIGIIANDSGRFTLFPICLSQLRHPPNTGILWHLTSDRIIGRNAIAKKALDAGGEWLLFLDDDHAFPGEILHQLLAHDEPIVGALYLQRQQPFGPIAYSEKNADGTYTQVDLREVDPGGGLIEVAACGTGGMLIRAEVLRAMPYPWFEHGVASEDLMFCDKARDLGFPIFVDPRTRMGHLSISSLWPSHDGERWSVGFQLSDGYSLWGDLPEREQPAEVAEVPAVD